jgi:hypothetical protein
MAFFIGRRVQISECIGIETGGGHGRIKAGT